ncbi:MAG TPA: HypC/HybG/HupF family hydrogenase formation chaperone [Candidatus Fermentibacter sp.]|nr:HypC/HybG/HupF family hydrogenase formation chaperone [Candidatus Fermentibacter sp.]
MCLGVPGEIVEISGDDQISRTARVSFDGVTRVVSLAGIPEAVVGDYVIVHAGFALNRLDRDEAARVMELIDALRACPGETRP